MAGPYVLLLLEQLASIIVRLVEGGIDSITRIDMKVRKLESHLRAVHAVLDNAENIQMKVHAVKLWLERLKDVSYEMDDVLDNWNTAIIHRKMGNNLVGQALETFDYDGQITELNEIFDEIVKEIELYRFVLTKSPSSYLVERPKTTSFVDVNEIVGRDNEKNHLVTSLLGKPFFGRNLQVISLVGMSGIGKTTLAQLAYNDENVKDYFEERIWVCVSEPFDPCRIAKAIIEAFGGGDPKIIELESQLKKVFQLIGEKKVLLVFDGVWTEDYTMWEPLKNVLKCNSHTRILVTTHKNKVAEMMESSLIINLEELNNGYCSAIFYNIAFSVRDCEQCKQLEEFGDKIVRKCNGLPLAAKTLGNLMRAKRDREQWKDALYSNLWELEEVERGLFAPFVLSYYDLPTPLKWCFSYCAFFPKEFEFFVEDLVFMWMAQGYIEPKANMEIEIMARKYFENLVTCSFLKEYKRSENAGKTVHDERLESYISEVGYADKTMSFKMHDIVHEFAHLIAKNECFTITDEKEWGLNYKNARHLYLEAPGHFPESIYTAKNLRTLIFRFGIDYDFSKLFENFKYLRTLTLTCLHGELTKLPDEIATLIHLRYFRILFYHGDRLPETLCNLCNLQTLKIELAKNRSMKLPQGMSKLINLRNLILDVPNSRSVNHIWELPSGIGKLVSLRTLSHFRIISGKDGDSQGCKLGELSNLNHLQGILRISGLGNVADASEADRAQLNNKARLRTLVLSFDGESDRGMEDEPLFLHELMSPPDLEELDIIGYEGKKLKARNWTNLKTLLLLGCINLEDLDFPHLGELPILESLVIKEANSLKKVEFSGNKQGPVFRNLKFLAFDSLLQWEEWIAIEERITIMPFLQKLRIDNCQKLKSLPDFLRTIITLQILEINNSPILSARCQRETGEDWEKISHIREVYL